jgi:hypothetical protein
MIAVHASSLALAAHRRSRASMEQAGEPCDSRQCRLIINDLQREIDRLRRGFDCVDLYRPRRRSRALEGLEGTRDRCPELPPSGSAARKAYAPAPLGKPSPGPELPPPPPLRIIFLDNFYHITNLGTLLDLLA